MQKPCQIALLQEIDTKYIRFLTPPLENHCDKKDTWSFVLQKGFLGVSGLLNIIMQLLPEVGHLIELLMSYSIQFKTIINFRVQIKPQSLVRSRHQNLPKSLTPLPPHERKRKQSHRVGTR